MRRIDVAVGAIVVLACSTGRDPSEDGATAGTGGDGTTSSRGGGPGGAAGGQGGGPIVPPEGGAANISAINEWMKETCNALIDEGCPPTVILESGHFLGFHYCSGFPIEVLPDMDTCGPSPTIELACVPRSGASSGAGCTTQDCPAEPAEFFYWYRQRPSGEVELYHSSGNSCSDPVPPMGFKKCGMKPSDPEACICRCEL